MGLLSREELMNEARLETESVEIKKGKSVIVTGLNGPDYYKIYTDPKNIGPDGVVIMDRFNPALVCCCLVDDKGKRLFSDDDIDVVAAFSKDVFLKLLGVAHRLNGLTSDEEKK